MQIYFTMWYFFLFSHHHGRIYVYNISPLLTEQYSNAETAWQVCKGNKKVIIGELQDITTDAKILRCTLQEYCAVINNFRVVIIRYLQRAGIVKMKT